jgi:hypothetical protein
MHIDHGAPITPCVNGHDPCRSSSVLDHIPMNIKAMIQEGRKYDAKAEKLDFL